MSSEDLESFTSQPAESDAPSGDWLTGTADLDAEPDDVPDEPRKTPLALLQERLEALEREHAELKDRFETFGARFEQVYVSLKKVIRYLNRSTKKGG